MTKPEVVEWLLKNRFICGGKRRINFYRCYKEYEFFFRDRMVALRRPRLVEEYVYVLEGSVWYSDTGEEGSYDECGLENVHIDEKGWLILENVWDLRPWEEIQ